MLPFCFTRRSPRGSGAVLEISDHRFQVSGFRVRFKLYPAPCNLYLRYLLIAHCRQPSGLYLPLLQKAAAPQYCMQGSFVSTSTFILKRTSCCILVPIYLKSQERPSLFGLSQAQAQILLSCLLLIAKAQHCFLKMLCRSILSAQ